jgi:hypothetical protein
MSKIIRKMEGYNIVDPSSIASMQFNRSAGSQKVSEVGRHLLPVPYVTGGTVAYKTDLSTTTALPSAGLVLAVYSKDTVVQSITLSAASIASLAIGVTDSSGNVGVPCAPGAWTYLAADIATWAVTSSANLLVFIVDDDTSVKVIA